MAKKRKCTKGTKQNVDNKEKEPTPKTRSSKRKNANGKNHIHNNGHGEVDDYQLRQQVEAAGTREIVDMNADGNCLFRALSDQLYRDHGESHEQIRSDICDHMEDNKNDFSVFLVLEDDDEDAADFESYINTMREDGEWGGNLELVAAARIYRRKITVFSATLSAFTIDHGEEDPEGPDLLLSYHDNDHYNSVRDKNSTSKPVDRQSAKHITSRKKGNRTKKDIDQWKEEDTTTASMSELSMDDAREVQESQKVPIKKNAQCPCGSNLKYKKCCLPKQKRAARLKKVKESSIDRHASDNNSQEGGGEASGIEKTGGFRVLNI